MSKIKSILAYEILASGGLPTVECRVETEEGFTGVASVPYGASAGIHEASVILDKDIKRYRGNGMLVACGNINNIIAKELTGMKANEQRSIDQKLLDLDGTEQKTKLGGNTILAVSMAVARAGASVERLKPYEYLQKYFALGRVGVLPKPMMVMIEGGKHADNSADFQEYLVDVTYSERASENVRVGSEIYMGIKKVLKDANLSVNVGNEGAFAPEGLESNKTPLEILINGIQLSGYRPGADAWISLDPAASEFFENEHYNLKRDVKKLKSSEMIAYYKEIVESYPILSIEDGLAEDDWDGWEEMYRSLGKNIKIVGDDLTVTNSKRLQTAIERQAINAILIKLNQAGSVTETVETCKLAKEVGFMVIPSHRGGGESNDTFMVDLAVAVGADFIKVGPTRGERVCKYNRLMEIERSIS
jgi:enolase